MSTKRVEMSGAWKEPVRYGIALMVLVYLAMACAPGLFSHSRSFPVSFSHLSQKDGLSQRVVYCIWQDRAGFMWFGTEDGLNKYDGYEFKVYRQEAGNPHSLSNNYITGFAEDGDGTLWIGTWNGLNAFNPDTGKPVRYMHYPGDKRSLCHPWVTALLIDGRGRLWVGTNKGLCRKEKKGNGFTRFSSRPGEPNSLNHNRVTALCLDGKGNVWVGTGGGGLSCINNDTGDFTRFLHSESDQTTLSSNEITCIYSDKKGVMWVGTNNGLNRYDESKSIFVRFEHKKGNPSCLSHNDISSILEDYNGHLWIGTKGGGLNVYDAETKSFNHYKEVYGNSSSLSHNNVLSLFEDRAHVLWAGTGSGLSKLDGEGKFFFHFQANPLDTTTLYNNNVRTIWEDRGGIVWIGLTGGGLEKMDRRTGRVTHFKADPGNPEALSHNNVRYTFEDSNGRFWIGTNGGGLLQMDRETGKFKRFRHDKNNPNSISIDRVRYITDDRFGNIWIGTQGGGINILNPVTLEFKHIRAGDVKKTDCLNSDVINYIFHDSRGYTWIGTDDNGLNKYDPQTGAFTYYCENPLGKVDNCLSNNTVFCIHEDRYGIFWIGTHGGGLNSLDPRFEWFSFYIQDHGLPNNVVYGILEDDDRFLWLSTNKGLSRFNPATREFTNYTVEDGLQENEFNAFAFHKGHSGLLYFGGINGFNVFRPRDIIDNPFPPQLAITDFELFNRSVGVGETINGRVLLPKSLHRTRGITLSYEENVFSFKFSSLHYASPRSNRFAYRLEGLEENWNYVSDLRYVVYTNLAPGTYTFRVKGSNNDDLWNHDGVSLKLTITPPFWSTLWFRVTVGIFFLFLLFLFVKIRTYRVRKLNSQLENGIKERTRELELANEQTERERNAAQEADRAKSMFLARMSHEIRTPMNGVIGFTDLLLDTKLDEKQFEYVRTIHLSGKSLLSLINDILDFSKIEAGRLSIDSVDFDPEMMAFDVCDLMLPRMGGKQVEMHCHVGDDIPPYVRGDAGRFRQVLVNLVGNAVKFTEKGFIDFTLAIKEQTSTRITLHAIVKDSGIGIPKDKIEGVFEVFQQADETVTRKFGGTGLGLAICKQIANLMNGDVWVESEEGKGSTFHFTARLEKSQKTGTDRKHNKSLRGERVLVVDDNPNNIRLLTRTLQDNGMRVTALDCGDDVLSTLKEGERIDDPFHICILDILMPKISGFDVCRAIRKEDSGISRIPVLAFSSATTARSSRYKEAGFDGFIPKPLQRKPFLEMIRKLLDMDHEEKNVVTQYSVREEAKHSVYILLVEDNPVNQRLAKHLLARAGYRIDIANNGKEAVETFEANPGRYDLIFMDIQMPEMDGFEATRRIRSNGCDKIPIIAMTADAIKGDREKCLDAGMNDYISKPVKREVVYEMVKKWALEK